MIKRKILVVHPWDETTDFLTWVYHNIDCDVIRSNVSPEYMEHKIQNSDQIICLGHGSSEGLHPGRSMRTDFPGLAINDSLVSLIKGMPFPGVYIWCYAKQFLLRNKIIGFCSDMFISEPMEAKILEVRASDDEIFASNYKFARVLNGIIREVDPRNLLLMRRMINTRYILPGEVSQYNRSRLGFVDNSHTITPSDWDSLIHLVKPEEAKIGIDFGKED